MLTIILTLFLRFSKVRTHPKATKVNTANHNIHFDQTTGIPGRDTKIIFLYQIIAVIAQNRLSKIYSRGFIVFLFFIFSVIHRKHQRKMTWAHHDNHNLLESYVIPQFSEMRLQKITHEFIENHCNELLKNGGTRHKGLSTKTVSDTLSVIRRVLKYASDSGRDTLNDGRSVKVKHSSKEIKVFSRSEQERLLSYLYQNPTSINTGIMLCLFTGMRVGEICALHWEDISLSEQTVYVHQTMQRIQNKNTTVPKTRIVVTTPKSSCSIRIIPLPKAVSTYIAKYCPPATGFFLTNSNHKYIEPRTMQNHFKRIIKECGLEKKTIIFSDIHLRHAALSSDSTSKH